MLLSRYDAQLKISKPIANSASVSFNSNANKKASDSFEYGPFQQFKVPLEQ